MKTLIMIVTCFFAMTVFGQYPNQNQNQYQDQYQSIVNITINGNRNKEVRIDGRRYTASTSISNPMATNVIQVTGLTPGQHTLEVYRSTRFGGILRRVYSKNFNIRSGYDIDVIVNDNGSFEISEKRSATYPDYPPNRYRTPMNTVEFDALINSIQNMRRSARITAIQNAFTGRLNYFTTSQASELIELVSSQTSRLELAKAAYPTITDPDNFSQMNDLLYSESSRLELTNYVRNYDRNNPRYDRYDNRNDNRYDNRNDYRNSYRRVPMTDVQFNSLYDNVQNKWGIGVKMDALVEIFNNESYYFTSMQARQLIQLVSNEDNRLQLAKSSYDNIVDRDNFSRLNDLFSTQWRRDELAEYVRTHPVIL